MNPEGVVQQVKSLIGPLLASRKVELVELTYRYGGKQPVLRFLVDTAAGIRMNELSALNQAIGALLDEHEAIPERYALEVSSPGLDRPLKAAADFERVIGRRVRVQTNVPVDEKHEHIGTLVNAGEEAILLRLDNDLKRKIALSQIARAVQEVDI